MKKSKKLVFDFDVFDDLLDAFDRVRGEVWLNITNCKDLEQAKLLRISYASLLNVQYLLLKDSEVIKISEGDNCED
jgi:hypothetical protein